MSKKKLDIINSEPISYVITAEDTLEQLNTMLWHKGLHEERDYAYKALLSVRMVKRMMDTKQGNKRS